MNSQNLWGCGSIPPKAVLIFRKKQGIINLSSYSSKGNASVVLIDSEIIFLWEVEDTAFCLFRYCLYTALHNRRSMSLNFLDFYTSGTILSRLADFFLLIFFSTASSSFSVNCPSLKFSWLFVIFPVGLSMISRGFQSKFLKCSFGSLSSLLAAFSFLSRYFSFRLLHLLSSMLIEIAYLLLNVLILLIGSAMSSNYSFLI